MNRDEVLKIVEEKVTNKNIIKHMLATEAVMKALCEELSHRQKRDSSAAPQNDSDGEFNVEEWGLAGLLHDGDYREDVPVNLQGIQIGKWVEEKGINLPEEIKQAMAAHNASNTGVKPQSKMDWSLFACDSLTGLITACTLVLPSKKLADVKVESVLKKFKTPSFAGGTRREDILMCEEKLGLTLEEFVTIALMAMQGVAPRLGL
ncbi:MAG: phosphohydrolase [Patescibacteria group bacterium]|nr:phosphohydrolase [Patescibacteria group bacterium]